MRTSAIMILVAAMVFLGVATNSFANPGDNVAWRDELSRK